jgi:hypothetical protein
MISFPRHLTLGCLSASPSSWEQLTWAYGGLITGFSTLAEAP